MNDMSMTAPLILSDLDDTLFQTMRKIPEDVPRSALTPASWLSDGEPSGYMTPIQRMMHRWLSQGEIVPVTARNRLVMERTFLKGCGRAICSHGGLILDEKGQADRGWTEHLSYRDQSSDVRVAEAYRLVVDQIARHGDLFRYWMISEEGVDLYVTVKQNRDEAGSPTAALHDACTAARKALPDDWKLHVNGNNVAFMPPWLGKRQAVEHMIGTVRSENPERPIIGFGDSTSDLPFMGLCDYMMTPSTSQVASILAATCADHF